jgi:hypothetical protein
VIEVDQNRGDRAPLTDAALEESWEVSLHPGPAQQLSQGVTLGVPNFADNSIAVGDIDGVQHLETKQHIADVHTVAVLEAYSLHFFAIHQGAVGGPKVLDHYGRATSG